MPPPVIVVCSITTSIFGVGPTTIGPDEDNLIEGTNIANNNGEFWGVELIETDIRMGDVVLRSGQILGTLDDTDDPFGDPPQIRVERQDIFILDVTNVETGGLGTTNATATLLFRGPNVDLANDQENIDGLTIVP